MNSNNVLSNEFIVRWDKQNMALSIEKICEGNEVLQLIQIKDETFTKMSFEESSKFIGERLILLIPHLREKFKKEFPFS